MSVFKDIFGMGGSAVGIGLPNVADPYAQAKAQANIYPSPGSPHAHTINPLYPAPHAYTDPQMGGIFTAEPRVLGYNTADPAPWLADIDRQIEALRKRREEFLRGHRERKMADYISSHHPDVAQEFVRVCDVQDALEGKK